LQKHNVDMTRAFLFVSLFTVACGSEVAPTVVTDAGGAKACVEGGKTYAHGASWKCSDGCNSCGCNNGELSSTTMACIETGPPASPARRCFPFPEGTHTSTACPSPESFGSIYLATFPCSEKCLRCPTSLSIVRDAYCDGSKWVAPSDICNDTSDGGSSGVEWYHGPPPACGDAG
jgi:hypothetical protein